MRIIDSQIHLWTGEAAPPHHWRTPFTIDTALAAMAEAGVQRAVNCPPMWDPDASAYADEAVRQHPDTFCTMGLFPLDENADEAMVDATLSRPGLRGLRFILPTTELGDQLSSGGLDWLWSAANNRALPVGLIVLPQYLPAVAAVAQRFPKMRLLMDHMAISPFEKLPEAAANFGALLELAAQPNIAVKVTGVPSMATDEYPFASTHDLLKQVFVKFGPERMFWGTDITRLHCTWQQAVTMFTEDLPWLKGRNLELVMGQALSKWINWP